MATVIDSVSKVLQEGLSTMVHDARLKMSPLFQDIVEDNTTAEPSSSVGRGWQVLHSFILSNAGAFRAFDNEPLQSDILYGETPDSGNLDTAVSYDTPTGFPGLEDFVSPGYARRTITLKGWDGNIFLPATLLRADQLSKSIINHVAQIMKGTARSFAQWRANLFFTRDATNKAVATVATRASGGTVADSTVTVTLAAGRVSRFTPGMVVDIWKSDGVTQRNGNGPLVVHSVDVLGESVKFDHTSFSAPSTPDVFTSQVNVDGTGDLIVLRSSKAAGPSGWKDWIKASGDIFGLSLTQIPQLKSLISTAQSGLLTDDILRQYFGGLCDSLGYDNEPDTIITTQGVLNGWLSEVDDLRQVQVQGAAVDRVGGFNAGYRYVHDGRNKTIRADRMIDKGFVYAIKQKNNIRRYTPPGLPKAGSNDVVGRDIEFFAPVVGVSGIWMPYTLSGGGVSKFLQAPWVCTEEYAAEVPQSLELSTFDELIAYS